jgi:hypothetical protein
VTRIVTRPPAWAATLLNQQRAIRAELAGLRRELRAERSAAALAVNEDDPIARLRAEAERLGIVLAPGGCVSESGAARLLGLGKATLKRRRLEGRPIAPPRRYLRRWHYSLADLAGISPEEAEEFAS